MVFIVAATVALLCLARAPAVLGHARVTGLPIRIPGQDFLQKCGQASFASVQGDPTGHIEEQEPVNAGCDLTLCRGMLFSDQPSSNLQTVKASENMEMNIDCTVPHGGPANVSLIDTTTGGSGSFIGGFLSTFDNFCPTSGPTPADQTSLKYTLPDAATIGNKCQTPGDCVVQLFWATPDFSQNYYYCVDVVMAAAAPPPASTSTPVAPVTTPVAPATTPVTPATTSVAPATRPVSPASAGNANAAGAASAAPSKFVTAPASSATGAGAAAAANSNNTAPVSTTNANAGRRRARLLWF